jgi:hypothetical protein
MGTGHSHSTKKGMSPTTIWTCLHKTRFEHIVTQEKYFYNFGVNGFPPVYCEFGDYNFT